MPSFPDLFAEVSINVVISVLVFAIADIRRFARDGVLVTGSDEVLNLPLQGTRVRPILEANKDAIRGKVRVKEYRVVKYIMQEYFKMEEENILNASTLQYFGDEKSMEECVYGILSNSKRKTITICFRGSVTVKDWVTDAKMLWDEIPNPLYDDKEHFDLPETLFLHKGFRDYLYSNYASYILPLPRIIQNAEQEVGDKRSKLEIILAQVEGLLAEYPDYVLYVTGHSLGGALALITAHEAAVRFGTPDRPVTCVAVANPKVGDIDFRSNIQTLEREGRLRCLLVHNHLDLVPLQPSMMCHCGTCRYRQRHEFCLQGMHLILYKHRFTLDYHNSTQFDVWEDLRGRFKNLLINVMCWIRMAEQHNYGQYLQRLMSQKEKLSDLYLDDLYKKEGIGM